MFDYIASGIHATQLKQGQDDLNTNLSATDQHVQRLADSVRKMALINQALLELLRTKIDLTDEELRLKIREVDLRDGCEDG